MLVGKREFAKRIHKYLELADDTDIVISHYGKPALILKKYEDPIQGDNFKDHKATLNLNISELINRL